MSAKTIRDMKKYGFTISKEDFWEVVSAPIHRAVKNILEIDGPEEKREKETTRLFREHMDWIQERDRVRLLGGTKNEPIMKNDMEKITYSGSG